ncbi:MAG: hypothetical protein IT434_15740 [Phycisphaerales bacterium]|nr:hypothetical protein [Phycisphaerales bacterium]
MKVTKRQRNGLLILALGLGALAIDRLVLQSGALGPKQAAASGDALAPITSAARPVAKAPVLSVAALIDAVPEGRDTTIRLDPIFSDPAWVQPPVKADTRAAATTDDQGKAHAITGVVWGRAESIILDGELLKVGQPGKSGRVLLRLDEARNLALVRIDARQTELAIPASMRPTRDRTPVPPVPPATPTPAGKPAKHPA